MRLPRHSLARGTVGALESLKAAQITPQEAAQHEIAKYGLVADVAGVAAGALETVSGVRQHAQRAKDEITYQTGESNLKAALKGLDNDPNLRKPEQDDGTPTPEYYQRETDAILKTYKEHIGKILDPKSKVRAEQLSRNRETLVRADMAGQLGVIETRIAEGELYTGFTGALDNKDYETARNLITTGKERLLLDPEKADKWTTALEKEENKDAAFNLIDEVDQGYAISQKEGDRPCGESSAANSICSIPQQSSIFFFITLYLFSLLTSGLKKNVTALENQCKLSKELFLFFFFLLVYSSIGNYQNLLELSFGCCYSSA